MAAIGIAIGVASLIALVGIINSGEADAQRDLLEQGIDVLELTPGTSFADDPELLPGAAAAIDTHMRDVVKVVASIRRVPATLRKTDFIPEVETGGIRLFAVNADDLDLLVPLAGAGWLTGDSTMRPPCECQRWFWAPIPLGFWASKSSTPTPRFISLGTSLR